MHSNSESEHILDKAVAPSTACNMVRACHNTEPTTCETITIHTTDIYETVSKAKSIFTPQRGNINNLDNVLTSSFVRDNNLQNNILPTSGTNPDHSETFVQRDVINP